MDRSSRRTPRRTSFRRANLLPRPPTSRSGRTAERRTLRGCRGLPGAGAPLPAADLRGPGRPGGDRPHPPERDPEEPHLARVPLRRTARRREDDHGPHPREGAQLCGERGANPGTLRNCPSCREIAGGYSRDVPEIDGASNNSVEKGARDHRDRALHPLARPVQDLPGGRGPHAERGRLQRAPQDARGTSFPRQVHLRDHRDPPDPGHHPLAVPGVRVPGRDPARRGGAPAAHRG